MYEDMKTVAPTQYVTPNVITFGGGDLVAEFGNRGELSVVGGSGVMTGESHALPGSVVFEVTDEQVDVPKLSLVNELDEMLPEGEFKVSADNLVPVDKSYVDGPTAFTLFVRRPKLTNPTTTGDAGLLFSGTETISTPKGADMEFGILRVRVTRQALAPIWLVEFFNSTDRDQKVGRFTTDTTVGTVAIDVTLRGGTRFQTTAFDRAAAHALLPAAGNTDDDIAFDIKTPRLGDRWRRTVANNFVGNFATKFAKMRRFSPPTTGTTLWTDALAVDKSVT
jgi:hypothetical protein